MNYDTEYPTKKAKIDRIKELEKEVVIWIHERDEWRVKAFYAIRENSDLQLKIDAMQTAIDGLTDHIDKLKKSLTSITKDHDILIEQLDSRDRRIDELKEECYRVEKLKDMKIDALRSADDALADKVKRQAEHIDQLLKVNVGLVEQNRELDKLEIDEPVGFVPTVECCKTLNKTGVTLALTGSYTVEFIDGSMKIIGVAK